MIIQWRDCAFSFFLKTGERCITGLDGRLLAALLPAWTEARMRTAPVFLALILGACGGAYHTPSDGRLDTRINNAYEARDACLARNAAADVTTSADSGTIARAVALACSGETEKLVQVSNRDGDPKVGVAIRKDSEFRAMGFVLRARGQASN
jgi:hypothetical protein